MFNIFPMFYSPSTQITHIQQFMLYTPSQINHQNAQEMRDLTCFPPSASYLYTKALIPRYDAPKPGVLLTTRQPAKYSWMSGNPTPLSVILPNFLWFVSIYLYSCFFPIVHCDEVVCLYVFPSIFIIFWTNAKEPSIIILRPCQFL